MPSHKDTIASRLGRQLARAADRAKPSSDGPSIRGYSRDPIGFASDIIGWSNVGGVFRGARLWAGQKRMLEAIRDHQRVAVASGRRTGKSTAFAMIALWFYCSFPGARVIITAPTDRQVNGILWREIKRLISQAKVTIPRGGILPKKAATGITDPTTLSEIRGFTARDAEAMQGIAGTHMLFIADEASGVADEIFEAISGNRASGAECRMMLAGNPTKASGEFYEAFHGKSGLYRTIHIDSRESPNVTGREPPIPGLATREWIDEMREEWGEDSAFFQIHIAGKFVVAEDAKIFPVAALDLAQAKWHDEPIDAGERLWIGLDPAGEAEGGDETALVPRRGRKVLDVITRRELSPAGILDMVLDALRVHRKPLDAKLRPVVVLDSEGRVGANVRRAFEEHLAAHPGDFELACVRSSERAVRRPRIYHLIRDELAVTAREWFRDGGTIPEHRRLYQELHAFEFFPAGPAGKLLKITPKEGPKGLRKLLGRSPDSYDAFVLSTWEPIALRRAESAAQQPQREAVPVNVYEASERDVDPYAGHDWMRT